MVLHDIMRCLILCIPLQEPNKIKHEVPQKFGHHRDAVPRHHVMPRLFWSKLPRHHFWQKRSPISKSALGAVPENPGTVLRNVQFSVGPICRGTTVDR